MVNHFCPNTTEDGIAMSATRKSGGIQFGELYSKAWREATKSWNAVSNFKAMGIMLLNETSIPDHAFIIDNSINEPQ